MNKTEMIQRITDKTELDESIVIKVLNACEEILAMAVIEKMSQNPSNSNLKIQKEQCAKIIQFPHGQDIKQKTN